MGEHQVRLAHEQGLLSRPSLNPVAAWALQYWIYLDRRGHVEDADRALEAHVSVMWPERWQQLYGSTGGDMGQAFGGQAEIPVTDASDLDEGLGNERGMTGAEAAVFGYADGPGVRV